MKAIIGLGNPGKEYEETRHNAGFLAIDILASQLCASYWKDECGASVAHVKNPANADEDLLLVKPQSFMNASGGPVKKICEKYKIKINDVIVIHDDMDILPSKIKIKQGGSNAGHNGLKSISEKLTSDDYKRIRVGIGHASYNRPYISYVLGTPKGKAKDEFYDSIQKASEAALFMLNHSLDKAQQIFN